MPLSVELVSAAATAIGAIPIVCLVVLAARRRDRDVAWWWLAAAFAVSAIADVAARGLNPWIVSHLYPVSQAALVGAVLLDRPRAVRFLVVLVVVATATAVWHVGDGPDVVLRTVAWLPLAVMAWHRRELDGWLRASLLTAFGVAWVAWLGYVVWPGWWSWGVYQGVRLVSVCLFARAVWSSPYPPLRLLVG
jgi:hypothetical protein